MDEVGTPYCFTIDGETLTDQTVTVRDRDTEQQERIAIDKVSAFLAERVAGYSCLLDLDVALLTALRLRTASASCSSSGTVRSHARHASVMLWP